MNRINKFYKDHEEALLVLAGATLGAALASVYVVNKTIAETKEGCRITDTWSLDDGRRMLVKSQNGDLNQYKLTGEVTPVPVH
jgi:hypothetical protein